MGEAFYFSIMMIFFCMTTSYLELEACCCTGPYLNSFGGGPFHADESDVYGCEELALVCGAAACSGAGLRSRVIVVAEVVAAHLKVSLLPEAEVGLLFQPAFTNHLICAINGIAEALAFRHGVELGRSTFRILLMGKKCFCVGFVDAFCCCPSWELPLACVAVYVDERLLARFERKYFIHVHL